MIEPLLLSVTAPELPKKLQKKMLSDEGGQYLQRKSAVMKEEMLQATDISVAVLVCRA